MAAAILTITTKDIEAYRGAAPEVRMIGTDTGVHPASRAGDVTLTSLSVGTITYGSGSGWLQTLC